MKYDKYMMFNKEELIKITGAEVLKDTFDSKKMVSISTDTRNITNENIYLPLIGEKFNGEDFIKNAVEQGATAYFTTRDEVIDKANLVLKVKDTKIAYIQIAKYYKEKVNPISVAITGSCGKTTTKELVYSVLSQKYKTQKTFSNHNNEIGFCQTVLGMGKDTQVLIIEVGMRGLGEIEMVSKPLQPNFAIITNSGNAHIGRLGSLENIAKAKCEIVSGMNNNGTLIAKNQDIIKNTLHFDGEKIFYSLADVDIITIEKGYSKFRYKDNIYELNVDGEYNIENSLAAIELGYKLNLTYEQILKGLKEYKPIGNRWQTTTVNNLNFINDSYNANPESMKVSTKTFIDLYKNPVVILGNMGELGDDEVLYHKQVGEYLSELKRDVTYLSVGDLAKNITDVLSNKGFKCMHFNNCNEVSSYIVDNFDESNTIFLKASRSMKFENIIENIKRGI